jgi:hypothetical protein
MCEKSLVESLTRCVKWNASGGKSGSAFLKTRGQNQRYRYRTHGLTILADDRFIAKEISKAELQTMETFAPAYFEYMSSAVTANVGHSPPLILLFYLSVPASYTLGQGLRLLQTHVQKGRQRKGNRKVEVHADEPSRHGKSVL